MLMNNRKSLIASVIAAGCVIAFAAVLVTVARSFRSAIADIAESETRVTIVNADGSVFYDSNSAVESHATREEVRRAFAEGACTTLRHSDTLERDFLYCARREGEKVVRLAIPFTGVLKSERLAWGSLAAAGVFGACVVLFVFFLSRRLARRIDEQTRRLAIAEEAESFRREFTSTVAHEIKSPLTAILGAAEMLKDPSSLSDIDKEELLGVVQEESTRLNALVRDVLSLARIEHEEALGATDFVPLALDALIEDVIKRNQAKAEAAKGELNLVRNDLAQVVGDAGRLEEILQNLIDNALKHSGSAKIELSSMAGAKTVEVSVRDFGIGIAAEHQSHLFERFYRVDKSRSRASGGTGLGLAIVKHLVQLHGGTVTVRSELGLGTTVTFALPLARG